MEEYKNLISNIFKDAGEPLPNEATMATILEKAEETRAKDPAAAELGTHVSWWARKFASEKRATDTI